MDEREIEELKRTAEYWQERYELEYSLLKSSEKDVSTLALLGMSCCAFLLWTVILILATWNLMSLSVKWGEKRFVLAILLRARYINRIISRGNYLFFLRPR